MSAVREQAGEENRAGARGGGAGGREGGECLCGGVERERSHDTMNTQTSDGAGGVTQGQTISVLLTLRKQQSGDCEINNVRMGWLVL